MPYKLAPGNSPIAYGTPFKGTDDINYTADWWRTSTETSRNAVGITWEAEPVHKDERFYWNPGGQPKDSGQLKTQWKEKQSKIAYSLLSTSDWRVTKAKETSGTVASAWKTYRAGVRSACNTRQTEIDSVADTDELAALVTGDSMTKWPDAPTS